ncbi:hypothetical protein HPP92_023553 [Vanilla planifolia]|uniref:Uncharacterized protein n=1 Tax=Vanilla planifolia TaxID=51239 RepID=A0A835UGD0_VANPL|nr:hypothetical protein HPP92_023553 [Vanilla planifolia]
MARTRRRSSGGGDYEGAGEGAERDGITANAVAPGPIATPMFFAGKTEEAGEGSGG